jgi:4-amino-4-deoxy-L-arabinose transferase-like glycosyltransferase
VARTPGDTSTPREARAPHEEPASREEPAPRWLVAAVALALALSVALSIASAVTRAPWWDEGLYADVARQFARFGTMRSTLMGESGSFGFAELPRMNARTYWTTPLYPLTGGVWMRVFGEGLTQIRLLSVAAMLLLVGSWSYVARRLTGSAVIALVVAALLALDSHVLWSGSFFRPEALAAGLAAAAFALYLRLRDERLLWAVCTAAALLAAGALVHPLVLVEALALAAVALRLDWRRLRPLHVAAALGVGLAVLSPWALYILQEPETFRGQWGANMKTVYEASRYDGLLNPIGALWSDLSERWLWHHFTHAKGLARMQFVKLVALTVLLGVALAIPAVRRRRGFGLLGVYALVAWVALAILDTSRYVQYFVHVYPGLLAFSSLALVELARRRMATRLVAAALVVGLVGPGLGSLAIRVTQNSYRNDYLAVVERVRAYQRSGARVVGGSELAFALGFESGFRDDMSMRDPADVYVVNEWYSEGPEHSPSLRQRLARDYRVTYKTPRYKVYTRRDLPVLGAGGREGCRALSGGVGRP